MTYQWDTFLLEAGFVALLMSFSTRGGVWLLRWLLFRFMFMSGVVKLVSGDPNWWNLSALSYHFLTQPLPTPLAWYAAQLPPAVLEFATGATFVVELLLPFLDLLLQGGCASSPPAASCCCRAASCSPATTTGSTCRPCCCAWYCSTMRRCAGSFASRLGRLLSTPTRAASRGGPGYRRRAGTADRVLQPR